MARFNPADVLSTYSAVAALTSNFEDIAALMERVVFRDGAADNTMLSPLDLNHFRLQNVADGGATSDGVNLGQVVDLVAASTGTVLPNATVPVASRAALAALVNRSFPAFLSEAGREGSFVWSSANNATNVTNDPQQGVYVAPSSDTTGASGAWVRKFSGEINVKWFGAKGDSVVAADLSSITSGTDDTAAILAALAYLNARSGGCLFFPEGKYRVSSYLTIPANVHLLGAHKKASVFVTSMAGGGGASTDQNIRNGSILYSNWPSNTGSVVHINVEHLGFIFTNSANQGAAFYDNGGTYLSLKHFHVHGGAYGAIFDQSELFDVDLALFESQTGAGVRVANGASIKAGNAGGYTNRGSVKRSQFNVGATVPCILDEGGMAHAYEDNNYNGGSVHIDASSVDGLSIRGGEWESATGPNIKLLACFTDVWGGSFNLTAGNPAIACNPAGGGQLSVGGGARFSGGGTTATAAITGVANLFAYWQGLTVNQMFNGQPIVDGTAVNHYDTTGKPVGKAVGAVPGTGFLTASQIAFQATATSTAEGDVISIELDHGGSGGQVYLQSLLRSGGTAYSDFVIRTRNSDTMGERVRFNETGMLLPAATHIYVGGTQVIAARQTGTAANATDLATALTLVNDLKAKLIAHGLIS